MSHRWSELTAASSLLNAVAVESVVRVSVQRAGGEGRRGAG